MRLSIIIPAFNEEKLITSCVAAVSAALKVNSAGDLGSEIIVVDNNSTDQTAKLATAAGARVVFERINQISRARNAGAAVAGGDWFLFVDADSWLTSKTLADLLACIRRGRCAGGGCLVDLDAPPMRGRAIIEIWNFISRTLQWAAGSFVFCRADLFRAIGGFPTDLFAAEELSFSVKLKHLAQQQGLSFVILHRHRHVSSSRKFGLYSRSDMLRLCLRALFSPAALRDRQRLALFYDGRR